MTFLDGCLSTGILTALVLNASLGWWWTDATAASSSSRSPSTRVSTIGANPPPTRTSRSTMLAAS